MRFTVTPLGSAGGRTVGQVVDDIVRYLEPRVPPAAGMAPSVPGGAGPSSYYADRGTETGRWLGYGARDAGLTGEVDSPDFARVLAGRDPRTGERLITAQGSAGRRATLGAGTETRRGPDGSPLYGVTDTAAALGISVREAEALVAAGERAAVRALAGLLGSTSGTMEPEGSYLVPIIDREGQRWISEAELCRCERAREAGPSSVEIELSGDPSDQLALVEAARLAGVTTRYLRGLCRRYVDHRAEIEEEMEHGQAPRRAFLVAYRGTKGQWIVKREDLAFVRRRAAPAVRVGYDLTLTTEKSLGVLALLGDDQTRATVLNAIEAGNDAGLAHFEYHASARSKGKRVLVRGLTIASFRHLTSRALDPFPHHHNVVANTAVDEYGTRRALDARTMYWRAQEASALATAEMRYQLTSKLGVRWRPGRSGGWEIDGISDEVVREFSRRRSEIEDALAELEEAIGRRSTLDELQTIVTATRPAKEEVDPSRLVAGWWERAELLGLDPEAIRRCTGRASPMAPPDFDRSAVFAALSSPERGLCAGSSIFTRSDALSALANVAVASPDGTSQPLLVPAGELAQLADEFLASQHVIELLPKDLPASSRLAQQPIFTTAEIIAVQRHILERYQHGLGTGAAQVADEDIDPFLTSDPQLIGEQRALVRAFCTSGDRIQCAIGRAGAGKTSTMRAAAALWTAAGYRVVGTAVKGEAARHLAEGAGIPTETVAWFLARRDARVTPLDSRTVLVVDEASTLSDRDLDALLDLVERTGATVRLVGDPAQHGAVAAGGMFRHLCEAHPAHTPELRITHRMTDARDRAAAEALRDGRIDDALHNLSQAGHLHIVDDELGLYVGMLRRWWDARGDGQPHPMVDRRHRTRHQLNRLARQLLAADGQLGKDEVPASGDRAFAAGDEVVARMVGRHLHAPGWPEAYVRNGAVGVVVAVKPGRQESADSLLIAFDGIGTVEVPRDFFDEHTGPGGRSEVGIDHAYAVTSYSVQGATYESSTSRIDEGASRSEAYVDITRGRGANHLFLTRAADPFEGEALPKAPPPPLTETVGSRLQASGPERAALELDPSAAQPDAAGRAEARGRRAARLSRDSLSEDVLDRLPPRPERPPSARRWDETISAVAGYRARWKPGQGNDRWAWAVGAPVAESLARRERKEVIAGICALVHEDARRQLRPHGFDDLPAWALRHVTDGASRGDCRIHAERTADLYTRVRQYRARRGFDDEVDDEARMLSESVLGPMPEQPAVRAQYRALAAELAAASSQRPPGRRIA